MAILILYDFIISPLHIVQNRWVFWFDVRRLGMGSSGSVDGARALLAYTVPIFARKTFQKTQRFTLFIFTTCSV